MGYDLAEEAFFHRELPFGAAIESMQALTLTNNKSGVTTTVPASALVVLVGAEQ